MSLAVRIFRSDRSCLLLVVSLSLVLFTTNLGGRDLWDPDEPRTAALTANMLETGAWAVLRLEDEAYLEKPPLFFWLAAIASLPSGRVSEFSVRLPANAAALLGVVCLFYLGRDLYGRRTGVLAAVALATTQDFFLEGRWAHPDMVFCFFLTAACFAFHRALRSNGAAPWLLGFYLAMGMAMLTKGPAGLLPLVSALVFLAASRNLPFLSRAGLAWGLPVALLPTVLWLAAYRAAAGGSFPVFDALHRIIARVTEGVHHPLPLTHILTSLPLSFLPWTLILPGAVMHTFPRRGTRDPGMVYLYSFLMVYLAVFAFSAEKRGVYLLPVLPLLALLIGRTWDMALLRWEPPPVDRGIGWGLRVGLLLAGGATLYCLNEVRLLAPDLWYPALILGVSVLLAGIAALLVHHRFGGGASLAALCGGMVPCYLVIALVVLPAVNTLKSARPLSRRVAVEVGTAPLAIFPSGRPAYSYYAGRRIEVIRTSHDLRAFLSSAPRTYCLMEEGHYESERDGFPVPTTVLDRARVGHRIMLLIGAGVGGDATGVGRDERS